MTTIRSRHVPIFLAYAQAAGLDAPALARELGLPGWNPAEPIVEIELERLAPALDRVAQAAGDPFLGIHLAEFLPRGTYGLVEFILRSAPSGREALLRLRRYVRLINNLLEITVHEDAGQIVVEQRIRGPKEGFGRQANEFNLAIFIKVGRDLAGTSWSPSRVWFAHPAPSDTSELQRYFGTPQLEFDVGFNGIQFDSALLDAPSQSADAELFAMLEDQACKVVPPEPTSLLERVRERIRNQLQSGSPKVHVVARMLHMSARTLQRRLATEGTTFDDVVQEVRSRLAAIYLANPRLSLNDVAYLLGYSELGPFSRAFRRWTGRLPAEERERLRCEGHARPADEKG